MVTSLIANDPGHNQSVDVSYFAQTPDGQRRNRNTNRYAIAKRSVFIFNLLNRNPSGCSWFRGFYIGRSVGGLYRGGGREPKLVTRS
jgi:hypothetical protein